MKMANSALAKLSVAEKIQMMEAIWDDLCRSPASVPPPDWHEAELGRRQDRIDRGETKWTEWEQAKRDVRDATR